MNIRVNFNAPIKDGTELVFRSPADCSKVTGLIVYYPDNGVTASREFAFADAHGENVGNIDYLFGKQAVIKVILDLDTNMAFVQNADTNAYLEGRFAELEDKIGKVVFGYGAPTEETEGKLGDFYYDQESAELYLCHDTGAFGEPFWEKITAAVISAGTSIIPITGEELDYLATTHQLVADTLYLVTEDSADSHFKIGDLWYAMSNTSPVCKGNIRGPQGEKGDPFTAEDFTPAQLNALAQRAAEIAVTMFPVYGGETEEVVADE